MFDKNEKRVQNGQYFMRSTEEQLYVGNVVWRQMYDVNAGRGWLEGPLFIVEIVHEGRMSQYYRLFSTHYAEHVNARWGEIWSPIIDTIEPPRGHNGAS